MRGQTLYTTVYTCSWSPQNFIPQTLQIYHQSSVGELDNSTLWIFSLTFRGHGHQNLRKENHSSTNRNHLFSSSYVNALQFIWFSFYFEELLAVWYIVSPLVRSLSYYWCSTELQIFTIFWPIFQIRIVTLCVLTLEMLAKMLLC